MDFGCADRMDKPLIIAEAIANRLPTLIHRLTPNRPGQKLANRKRLWHNSNKVYIKIKNKQGKRLTTTISVVNR